MQEYIFNVQYCIKMDVTVLYFKLCGRKQYDVIIYEDLQFKT